MKKALLLVLTILISCQENKQTTQADENSKTYLEESHSYAQPNDAVITDLDLDINVDFEAQVISGTATYDIENSGSNQIILDSKFLEIESVTQNGEQTEFDLGDFDESLGQPLTIAIKEDTKQIAVTYSTTAKTEALQWLTAQQTADKTNPFLFTQGQAILTRTWIPIQDSPQIRITYDATVKVPSQLMAVMSAENPKEKNGNGVYHFKMKQLFQHT
ncbi:aminopeptidase [Nonlabens ulvanivorans]|uniref:Aminopeptidase n=1 Tax=Nonlabens ulvanivorans TaxID=906888 RepID=A0A081DAF2_NONUL|nr:hypothetical protein [Nonlabens ulvanivorans]GAK75898.1 aminopeptidase [Nonlabens ulvanivorans]